MHSEHISHREAHDSQILTPFEIRKKLESATALFVLLILSLVSATTPCQSPGTKTTPRAVELKNEPHHHLKFENKYVRVWETLITAGERTLWHRHANDHVIMTLDGATVHVDTMGTAPTDLQARRGEVGFRRAPFTHRTVNVGTTPFRNLVIEIRQLPLNTISKRQEEPGGDPIIENERVRVYRLELAPGASTGMQTRLLPGIMVTAASGQIVVQTKGKRKAAGTNVTAGEARWHIAGFTRSITNIGKKKFEALDIELK